MNWGLICQQLSSGNNEVLEIFFKNHGEFCVKKLVRENKCSKEDAEDIFIEAIMDLREKLISAKITTLDSPRHYIYKTCYYMLLRRLEENTKRKNKSKDVERYYYTSSYRLEDNFEYDPELMRVTMEAWEYLSEKCRDILSYFYIDKMSMDRIAECMNLSNSNVAKTTKSRCYKTFVDKGRELQVILEKTRKF